MNRELAIQWRVSANRQRREGLPVTAWVHDMIAYKYERQAEEEELCAGIGMRSLRD